MHSNVVPSNGPVINSRCDYDSHFHSVCFHSNSAVGMVAHDFIWKIYECGKLFHPFFPTHHNFVSFLIWRTCLKLSLLDFLKHSIILDDFHWSGRNHIYFEWFNSSVWSTVGKSMEAAAHFHRRISEKIGTTFFNWNYNIPNCKY